MPYIFWILSSCQIHDSQIFSPIQGVAFHSFDDFFCCAAAFSLKYPTCLSLLLESDPENPGQD